MEPVTTSVAAGSVVAASTSASASASAAGGASAATIAKQSDSIRRLASAFVKTVGMKTVGDSEIVDEFASPIYAGLSAVPMGPASPASVTSATNTIGASPELAGPAGISLSVPKSASEELQHTGQQMPPRVGAKMPPLSVEKPEVKELIDRYYEAPAIKEQLATGQDKIVIERNVLEEKVSVSGDKRTAFCLIEERVVDRKYLEHGNLTDMISEVRHGNIPTVRQLYLAVIDLMDLATFKVFRPLLARVKLEDATCRVRQLTADFERKVLEPSLQREDKNEFKLDRKIEDRSWFKTDHVVEKIAHKDVETSKQLEIVATNVTDLCTVELKKSSIEGFIARREEISGLFKDAGAISRIEGVLPPETIASVNKKAMAWVRESLHTTTSEYSTTETFHHYGVDLGAAFGKKIETSEKVVTKEVKNTLSEYLSFSDKICLEDVKTYDQAFEKFASLQKTARMESDPQVVESYIEPSEGVTFDEGWITYIPGGSMANLGFKSDLGCDLTGWDYFWAAVDVATIAVAVATCGASSAAVSPAALGVRTGAKAVAKQAGKVVVKNVGKKVGAKASVPIAKSSGSAIGNRIVSVPGRVVLRNSERKVGARAARTIAGDGVKAIDGTAVKDSVKTSVKVSTKTGLEPNFIYEKGGFTYTTDSRGRVIKASGKLKNSPGVRNPENQIAAKNWGINGDQGGHLIPARYGGPGDLINHVPQAEKVNLSTVKRIENEMGRAIKQGKNVDYTIMPHYPVGSETLRPDKFTIRYTIDGITKIRRITNG